jgi:hypothetical protein
MLWAACVRVDLPADAPFEQVQAVAAALDGFAELLEHSSVTLGSAAFSAAGLEALARLGFSRAIERLAVMASIRRVELLSTAAQGAVLPLLPAREIERQIQLNDRVNRSWFGDAYRPECLWPPELAASHTVAEVASAFDYTCLLVDEHSPGGRVDPWPGDEVDSLAGLPGFFLIPVSRSGSHAFTHGHLRSEKDLRTHVGAPRRPSESYLVTSVDLGTNVGDGFLRSLRADLDLIRTVRIRDLFRDLPTDRATPLVPGSRRATAAELGCGLPFATWFNPKNEAQRLRWHLQSRLLEIAETLEAEGYSALPAFGRLRSAIDAGWREAWFRGPAPAAGDPLEAAADALRELNGHVSTDAVREVTESRERLRQVGPPAPGGQEPAASPLL